LEFCNCSDLDIDELGIVRRKPERVNTAEKLANFEEDARLPNIVGILCVSAEMDHLAEKMLNVKRWITDGSSVIQQRTQSRLLLPHGFWTILMGRILD
jgi:hypothetical protein